MVTVKARAGTAAILAGAIALAACSGGGDAATDTTVTSAATSDVSTPREADGVLSLGVLFPKTGPGATQLGAGLIKAVSDAVVLINAAGGVLGQGIRITEADEAVEGAMAALIDGGVDAIIGPASSTVALAQLHTAVDAGVVVCSPTATALALDDYPAGGWFFRTAPSDSLQMVAIELVARGTGASTMSVAYLDDPYGRGLAGALTDRVQASGVLSIADQVPFASTDEDLSSAAEAVLAGDPGVVVVLADGDDGGRFLAALDAVGTPRPALAQVIVNDAVRTARQTIAGLSDELRPKITAVAPRAEVDRVEGFFAANAVDCVNLIALAVERAQSDKPNVFRSNVGQVSYGGAQCDSFAACKTLLDAGSQIDYQGLSGSVDLRTLLGELRGGNFDVFQFDTDGNEIGLRNQAASAL